MAKLINEGRTRIQGEISIGGAKNSILPILACTLLTNKTVRIKNCPKISDVNNMLNILKTLGGSYYFEGDSLYVDTAKAETYVMPPDLSRELRSSIFMLGSILARFGQACCVYPGGCEIGNRPIGLHLSGLKMLNVSVIEEEGSIICNGENMEGTAIHLDYPSVGATENLMMAASGAKGKTIITNAAREPEIEDLQAFMRKLGFNVTGAGTSTIEIDGKLDIEVPDVVDHKIISDRIVAGSMLCAAAICGGNLNVKSIEPLHISSTLSKLREAGCNLDIGKSNVHISATDRLKEIRMIETLPHPGFPTDMQALLFALCTVADGTSIIVENVFENRFKHAPEFTKMGAVITQRDRTAIIRGVKHLRGAHVTAQDLRGGAALVIAGLAAWGYTTVDNVEFIDRGYERIEDMLNSVGANITRIN
ncbi:MAG: UDP-N-acetylglucosamine 1-carboxyvinyltransferase [Clostridiales bacterium]|nr:UDP-N-acetylglucosamine 1-carboxyvinyltransferase [Clostridiales bacterium]